MLIDCYRNHAKSKGSDSPFAIFFFESKNNSKNLVLALMLEERCKLKMVSEVS